MVNKHPENMGLKVWSSRIFLLVLYHHNSSFHRYDCLLHQVESVNPHNWRLSPYHMRSGQNPHAAMVDIQRRIAHTAIYIYIYINIYVHIYIYYRERDSTLRCSSPHWDPAHLSRHPAAVAETPSAKPWRRGQVNRGKKSSKRWGFNGKHPP